MIVESKEVCGERVAAETWRSELAKPGGIVCITIPKGCFNDKSDGDILSIMDAVADMAQEYRAEGFDVWD